MEPVRGACATCTAPSHVGCANGVVMGGVCVTPWVLGLECCKSEGCAKRAQKVGGLRHKHGPYSIATANAATPAQNGVARPSRLPIIPPEDVMPGPS